MQFRIDTLQKLWDWLNKSVSVWCLTQDIKRYYWGPVCSENSKTTHIQLGKTFKAECLTNGIAVALHKLTPQCLLGCENRARLDFMCWLMALYCQQTVNRIVNAMCWPQYHIVVHRPDVFNHLTNRYWDLYNPFSILGSSLIAKDVAFFFFDRKSIQRNSKV